MRVGLALSEGSPPGVGALFPTSGEPGQALFVPVVVVYVHAIEAFDHLGGVVEPFHDLEDYESDAGAAAHVGEAVRATVRVTCRSALESAKGLTRIDQMSFQGPTWRVGGRGLPGGTAVCGSEFEGDVADAGGPICDAQLAGAQGHVTAILAAHVRDACTNQACQFFCVWG